MRVAPLRFGSSGVLARHQTHGLRVMELFRLGAVLVLTRLLAKQVYSEPLSWTSASSLLSELAPTDS